MVFDTAKLRASSVGGEEEGKLISLTKLFLWEKKNLQKYSTLLLCIILSYLISTEAKS